MKARGWARLALLAGGTVLGLLGAELFVRAFVSVRDVGPPLTEYDPVLGQRIKRNFECVRETPEFRMRFSSNSLGWRGPEPAGPQAEIVFLGDSFTMGYGVDDGREFPQLLGRALAVPVANLGLGGTGQGRWAPLLRGEASTFQPKTVVLQLSSNDVEDDVAEGLASLDDRGELVHRAPSAPSPGRRLQTALELVPGLGGSHLVGWLRQCRSRGSKTTEDVLASTDSRGLTLATALVDESIRLCAERRWRTVVFSADMSPVEAAPFEDVCRRRGIPFVRMPSKSEAPDLYFVVDGHWTEAGHRRAAEMLEPWLRHDRCQ